MPTTAEPLLTTNVAAINGRPPRLLLVAYSFPPVGGAGVQRPVKWVKNLRRMGWDVTVLTTENPSVPTRDESLLADIPEDVLVVRAKTWEPDYRIKKSLQATSTQSRTSFVSRAKSAVLNVVKEAGKLMLQPDPQVLWVANAITAGKRVLHELTDLSQVGRRVRLVQHGPGLLAELPAAVLENNRRPAPKHLFDVAR